MLALEHISYICIILYYHHRFSLLTSIPVWIHYHMGIPLVCAWLSLSLPVSWGLPPQLPDLTQSVARDYGTHGGHTPWSSEYTSGILALQPLLYAYPIFSLCTIFYYLDFLFFLAFRCWCFIAPEECLIHETRRAYYMHHISH